MTLHGQVRNAMWPDSGEKISFEILPGGFNGLVLASGGAHGSALDHVVKGNPKSSLQSSASIAEDSRGDSGINETYLITAECFK